MKDSTNWPSWKSRIKTGDLVRFSDEKRQNTPEKPHLQHIFEVGLVIDTNGLDPVVAFPSSTGGYATSNLEVISATR